ncbi:transmembrane protein 141 [Hyalella azteca]|uniref:Transmembrane protein 141 n=1 Tax=Hyalella azteca TaxID=294128 RepID=A0A8B7P358_HYAAZ|nr:transmembrane protein 141 [Hyalella azteca]
MTDRKSVILNLFGDKHPGLNIYLECVSRAYLYGLATSTLSFACSFSAQRLLSTSLPYSRNGQLLVSALIAAGTAYKVSTTRTLACQEMWMKNEENHRSQLTLSSASDSSSIS